jgi:hypothetical protein
MSLWECRKLKKYWPNVEKIFRWINIFLHCTLDCSSQKLLRVCICLSSSLSLFFQVNQVQIEFHPIMIDLQLSSTSKIKRTSKNIEKPPKSLFSVQGQLINLLLSTYLLSIWRTTLQFTILQLFFVSRKFYSFNGNKAHSVLLAFCE